MNVSLRQLFPASQEIFHLRLLQDLQVRQTNLQTSFLRAQELQLRLDLLLISHHVQGHRDFQDRQGHRDHQGQQVIQDHEVMMDLQDHRDHQVWLDHKALLGHEDLQDFRVLALLDHQDRQDHRGHQDHRDQVIQVSHRRFSGLYFQYSRFLQVQDILRVLLSLQESNKSRVHRFPGITGYQVSNKPQLRRLPPEVFRQMSL